MTKISICIPTFGRPESLRRLLESIKGLRFKKCPEPKIKIIIVDNDSSGTASQVQQDWSQNSPWELIYEIEPRRGISIARNRLVKLAKNSEFIAFVDDDEVVFSSWLDELMFVQRKYEADVVVGPVLKRFSTIPPRWAIEGGFFNRPRYSTGHPVKHFGIGNCFISTNLLERVRGPFDERLALSGGEDTLLAKRLKQIGVEFVWADDAIIEEIVPESRLTLCWLFQRSYRGGNTLALCDRYLSPCSSRIIFRALKSILRFIQGTLMIICSALIGRTFAIQGICVLFQSVGTLYGILGGNYQEYREVHGK